MKNEILAYNEVDNNIIIYIFVILSNTELNFRFLKIGRFWGSANQKFLLFFQQQAVLLRAVNFFTDPFN